MAITFLVALFNVFLANWLPLIETVILVLHFAGFVGILVPLWVLAPKTAGSQVWDGFVDAGWGNSEYYLLLWDRWLMRWISWAFMSYRYVNIGGRFRRRRRSCAYGGGASRRFKKSPKSHALDHYGERRPRLRHACVHLPPFYSLILSSSQDTSRTFCYTVGDIEAAITSPTGYPIIEVFYNATGSAASATGLSCLLIILNIVNNLTNMAGASRQMFAFARDRGLPFSGWVSRVPSGYDVPINAIIVSALCACVLHCINIGSSIAFNIIMSIGTVAMVTSYLTSIGCVTWRRLRGLPLLESKFSMGKAGVVVNLLSLAFLVLIFVFAFFPPVPNPPAATMNWAIVVYVGVLGIAAVYYLVRARHHYDGPVAYVRKSA